MINRYSRPEMKDIWSLENKFKKWLEVELAACDAWGELGKIPEKSLKNIKRNARFSLLRIEAIEKTVDHDMIAFLSSVAESVGTDARFIHMGLTSSDVVDTALSLLLIEGLNLIRKDVKEFIPILKAKAHEYKMLVCMGRTHGVHAEPMTLGLKFALWFEEMQRNLARIDIAIKTISVGKFSGAVGTYSNIDPKVEKIACGILKLKPAKISTQIIQRDRHAEVMNVLAVTAASIEKMALEIRSLQRTETNELEEPFKKGQKGSSAMPHKRNPITCERMCGLARVVRANAMVAMENIALWHERDISHSSCERIIIPDSMVLLDYMLNTFSKVIGNIVVHPENMKRNMELSGGIFYSQRILISLIDKGMSRDNAYVIVQRCAMQAREEKREFKDIVMQDQEVLRYLSSDEIINAFDINFYLRNIKAIFARLKIK